MFIPNNILIFVYILICVNLCMFVCIPVLQTPWNAECDVWWDDVMNGASEECEPEWLDAEDPLFILYTSGSTGKPKARDSRFLFTIYSTENCMQESLQIAS